MKFEAIPGFGELKKQLITSFERGKVAHAQLFVGNEGTATLPLALAYATYIMCENKTAHDSCGKCANCIRIEKGIHPDMHWFFPKVSASDRTKYDKVVSEALPLWRSFISDNPYGDLSDWALHYGNENKNIQISRQDSREILRHVSMKSVEGGFKIIFIWSAESMHPSGANALLKILEEPPANTIYFLISNNYDVLLQTITSRSQLVSIPPNSYQESLKFLIDRYELEEGKAAQLAKVANGRIGLAVRMLQSDEQSAHNQFRSWMLACWNRDIPFLVKTSEDFSKEGKTNQRSFLTYSLSLIRNALHQVAGIETTSVNQSEEEFIAKFAIKVPFEKLQSLYELINEALQHLERNSNPRITHLNLSLAILRIING